MHVESAGSSVDLPKGKYDLQLHLRHDNAQILEKMRHLRQFQMGSYHFLNRALLKSEYLKHTPLLAKILGGLISRSNVKDKIPHNEEVIDAAIETIYSVDICERLGAALRVFCDIISRGCRACQEEIL
ncbi:hypothetical protein VNO77_02684 [Canavalia gladiata]|uniref:Uncharacterized protein n=1 Tax=Canavalia gladiata TaxID=3824 RepID=A0AAN9MTG5_CANGL